MKIFKLYILTEEQYQAIWHKGWLAGFKAYKRIKEHTKKGLDEYYRRRFKH